VQVIEKEFREARLVFQYAGEKFVDVQTAVKRDTA